MSRVEFEATIPVFERVKTFHAIDRAAALIDELITTALKNRISKHLRIKNTER
jgi:hypothetical protein